MMYTWKGYHASVEEVTTGDTIAFRFDPSSEQWVSENTIKSCNNKVPHILLAFSLPGFLLLGLMLAKEFIPTVSLWAMKLCSVLNQIILGGIFLAVSVFMFPREILFQNAMKNDKFCSIEAMCINYITEHHTHKKHTYYPVFKYTTDGRKK